jgi:uncharacterized protein YjbI with pentapeptide repeats
MHLMKELKHARNSSATLIHVKDLLITTSTSESGLIDPADQRRRERYAVHLIESVLSAMNTGRKSLTCGEVAEALRIEFESALDTAYAVVDQGVSGLLHRSDSQWPKNLRGTVTCHFPYFTRPVGDIESYFDCFPDKAKFVRLCLTIRHLYLTTDGEDHFLLSLSHITLEDIQFDSYRPGSIKLPHSQIKGGVFNTPYAIVDLTNAKLEKMRFGNPRSANPSLASRALTFTGATCTDVDFAGINPFAWHAEHSRFLNVNLSNAILMPADFSHARLENVCFDHTEAKGIDLRDAELKNVIWRYSNFSGARLKNTVITLDLSDEALEKDPGFLGAIWTIDSLPDHYKTLRNELALSVKQRLTELAVDRPQSLSTITGLERLSDL